jgi:hypothetical protein
MFDSRVDGAMVVSEYTPDVSMSIGPEFAAEHGSRPVPWSKVPTSGWLGVELDLATDRPAAMSDAELVEAVVGFERMASWVGARQSELLAEFARRRPVDASDAAQADTVSAVSPYAADEVGLALRISRGTAAVRLEQARRLDGELTETRRAWHDGRIDVTKVRAILDATANLPFAEQARLSTAVQDRVLSRASEQTAGQVRAALARAVISVDPAGAAQRHTRARRDRRVAVNPDLDGMASLWALLPAPDALSAYEWLTRLATGMGAEDSRGMDARRADLLVALLTGRLTVAAPGGDAAETAEGEPVEEVAVPVGRSPMPQPVNPGKPLVQIVIPLDTLSGAAEHPADLVGYGPIPAPLAREIAADGVWKRLVTDPLSGALLDYGRTTYRPPAALADFVRARDVQCRHPICRRRAIDSELDHTIAYAGDGGETSEHNLYGACVHHHHLKHEAPGWSVVQHRDGRVTWTTPTGHTYTSSPYDYRIDDEPDLAGRRHLFRGKPPPPGDIEAPF